MQVGNPERDVIVQEAGLDDAEIAEGYAVADLAGDGQAIDFRSAATDFGIRLSSSGPRQVSEHAHDNIQISIPLGSTIASVAWRTLDGSLKHAFARRGHALIVPAQQRHAVAWKNRARFVNIHLSADTTSDRRHGLLRRIERLGEAHIIADSFLARLGEIIVLRAAKDPGIDEAALQSFRMIVETHVMNPCPSAMPTAAQDLDLLSEGGLALPARRESCGLSPAPLRKITAAIQGDLARNWTVDELAESLGMSAGHFSRAFRRSTGAAPRQWIIRQRIDAAMDKLLMTRDSLAEIALGCGFAEQTHFTRTFTRMVGSSPGAWRRRHRP
jgi:AraC-like DNA-binding protein